MSKPRTELVQYQEPTPGDEDEGSLPVTLVMRAKHGLLWQAVRKLGTQSAVARYLGIPPSRFSDWCSLKEMPKRTNPRWDEWEVKFMQLIGKTMEDIFPEQFRDDDEFLRSCKRIELDNVPLAVQPDGARQLDLEEVMKKALKILPYRCRVVLQLRYGLGDSGGNHYTLEEVGHILKVTGARVRQIEASAVQRLRNLPPHLSPFGEFDPEHAHEPGDAT